MIPVLIENMYTNSESSMMSEQTPQIYYDFGNSLVYMGTSNQELGRLHCC